MTALYTVTLQNGSGQVVTDQFSATTMGNADKLARARYPGFHVTGTPQIAQPANMTYLTSVRRPEPVYYTGEPRKMNPDTVGGLVVLSVVSAFAIGVISTFVIVAILIGLRVWWKRRNRNEI
jgi:hypothetical protein